jgi:hypothetical protein
LGFDKSSKYPLETKKKIQKTLKTIGRCTKVLCLVNSNTTTRTIIIFYCTNAVVLLTIYLYSILFIHSVEVEIQYGEVTNNKARYAPVLLLLPRIQLNLFCRIA